MKFNAFHFLGLCAVDGSSSSRLAPDLGWLIILLATIVFAEFVTIIAIVAKMRANKKGRQFRTYVSLLPVLLLGAAGASKSGVTIGSTLGALAVADVAVIATLLIIRARKAKKSNEQPADKLEPPAENEEPIPETIVEETPAPVEETVQPVEEPAEEPVEQVAEEPVAAVVPEEPADEGNIEDLTGFSETGDASGMAYDARRHVFVVVRYDRSYTSKLIQSDDKTKSYYDEIKGELMSYKGVKSRISWRHENFRIGRERVAKLQFRGKKLCLYLPLDPNDYKDSKYKIEDFSDVVKNKEVPLAYLIKNDLRARYAKELIAIVMERFGAEKLEGETETYSQEYPYDTLDNLIGRKLIKVLMGGGEEAANIEEEAPVEEPATEPVEQVVEEPVAADVPEEPADEGNIEDLTGFSETGDASGMAYDARRHVFVVVRYDRSYTSKLIQSDDKTKSYYDEIKGELMSYKGVKSRISWRHENFRIGRERVAKLQFRGKKLCLYLPLDPNDYKDSKYKIEDFSDVVKNREVPLAYLIKNDLRARYAKELIAIVMERFGAEKLEGETETYSQDYPYDTLDNLIGRKLIKVLMGDGEEEDAAADMAEETPCVATITIPEEQPAQEPVEEQVEQVLEEPVEEPAEEQIEETTEQPEDVAEAILPEEIVHEVAPETAHKLLSDERAEHLIVEGTRYADTTRKGLVNVDALSRNFNAGEIVTLDEMKKRIKGFDKRATYVKVLARGILDKPLTVEGDDFSIDAAKMILLTGGKVIRTKRK